VNVFLFILVNNLMMAELAEICCLLYDTQVKSLCLDWTHYTVCPTRYRTRHFFNNSNTNADIETKFEQEYVRCVRNEEECVCSVCL